MFISIYRYLNIVNSIKGIKSIYPSIGLLIANAMHSISLQKTPPYLLLLLRKPDWGEESD